MDKIVKGYPNWDIPLNANIDEYNATMGNAELLTEDKTIKGAINEIKTKNDETIGKIKDDTQINTADISNLKTSVAQNTTQLNAIALYNKASCSYAMSVVPNYTLELATDTQSNVNLFDIEEQKIKIKKDGVYLLKVKGFTNLTTLGKGIKLEMYVDGNLYDTGYQDMSIGENLIIDTTILSMFRINHVVSFKLHHNNDTNVDIQSFQVELIWLRGLNE